MTAYRVTVYPPGVFNGWYARVTAQTADAIQATGFAHTEHKAIANAWREYWRKAAR